MCFDKLAVEIIQTVFRQTLPELPTPDPSQSPLLLTQISRRWRMVAVDTSSLWTCCVFGGPTAATTTRRKTLPPGISHINALDLWLQRSGTRPLQYTVYSRASQPDINEPQAVLNALLAHSNRWKAMQLTFPREVLRSLERHSYPMLKNLRLNCFARRFAPQGDETIAIPAAAAPRLRALSVSGLRAEQIEMPWGQLEDLSFSGWTLDAILDALRPCGAGKLRSFVGTWSVFGGTPTDGNVLPPLARLEFLRLTTQDILPALTLPGLRHLHLLGVTRRRPAPLDALTQFILRSRCEATLQSLTIGKHVGIVPAEQLYALLRLLPSLLHLNFKFDHDYPSGLEIMAGVLADTSYVPELGTLLLRSWLPQDGGGAELVSLVNALRTRFLPGSKLRRVEIILQARASCTTPEGSPPPEIGDSESEREVFHNRHRTMVPLPLVQEFRSLSLGRGDGIQLYVATARPADGFGAFVDREEDLQVLVDTWNRGEREGESLCRCEWCLRC
ncbi:hypothetical protein MKEN_00980000 [Mycena kentingensis (nom. inval.)]|nr:hypothetical protein MKEN_00980000 [Mycena kentingensis (nom. inval.)]